MVMAMLRTSSIRQVAGPEGAHAWIWWCLLHRSTERQNGSNGCKRIQNMHSLEVSLALGEACASTVMEDPSFLLGCSQEP